MRRPTEWTPQATAKILGISLEAATQLTPRQRHVAIADRRDPNNRHGWGIDGFLAQQSSKWFSQVRPIERKPKSKAKPMRPDLQQRYNRLMESSADLDKQRAAAKKRDTAARVAKLLEGYEPKPKDPLDIAIAAQLKTQPEKHRDFLKLMYSGWVANNAAYFGGRLKLPIIKVVPNQPDSQAYTDINVMPCVIAFCEKTPVKRSTNYCLETLLHEMVHQAIAQHAGAKAAWGTNQGHHAEFARICNNIAKARGWKDCYVGPVSDGHSACHWPHH